MRAETVQFDGPNRVVVRADAPAGDVDRLVVLVSDHPGWRLRVDGRPAEVVPANRYLGAIAVAGAHTYVFEFDPPAYDVGRGISVVSLVGSAGSLAIVANRRGRPRHQAVAS